MFSASILWTRIHYRPDLVYEMDMQKKDLPSKKSEHLPRARRNSSFQPKLRIERKCVTIVSKQKFIFDREEYLFLTSPAKKAWLPLSIMQFFLNTVAPLVARTRNQWQRSNPEGLITYWRKFHFSVLIITIKSYLRWNARNGIKFCTITMKIHRGQNEWSHSILNSQNRL